LEGVIGSKSSLKPIKNIITNAQRMYCRFPKDSKGVHKITEKSTPAKIPIPPSEGVAILCEERSLGSSNNRFLFAIRTTDGMTL